MLDEVGKRADGIGRRLIAAHWPFVGTDYPTTRLLIVGQALAGWDDKTSPALWTADRATTPGGRRALLTAAQRWAKHREEPIDEPLAWRGGAFWDLNRHLVNALEPDRVTPWQARMAWWNLFPLGWGDNNRSPWFDHLWEAQMPHLADLFWESVEFLEPRRIVILAGAGFWPHTAPVLGLADLPRVAWPLIAGGQREGRAIVWSRHPGGHYKGLTRPAFARTIAEAVLTVERRQTLDDLRT
jgi:hypothetical protein